MIKCSHDESLHSIACGAHFRTQVYRRVLSLKNTQMKTEFLCHYGIAKYLSPEPKHDNVITRKRFPLWWPFVRESTGHRWIPSQRARNSEIWCEPELSFEQIVDLPMIVDVIKLMWPCCNESWQYTFSSSVKECSVCIANALEMP